MALLKDQQVKVDELMQAYEQAGTDQEKQGIEGYINNLKQETGHQILQIMEGQEKDIKNIIKLKSH